MTSSPSSSSAVTNLRSVSASQSDSSTPLLTSILPFVPSMSSTRHKGQSGRIMTIGGSTWYTGAPYFASQTALLMGADLVTVITTHDAAAVIKSYSPELMVRPLLVPEYAAEVKGLSPFSALSRDDAIRHIVKDMTALIDKSNAVCLGPGLSTDTLVQATVTQFIHGVATSSSPPRRIPFVCDGDGIALFVSDRQLLNSLTVNECVFTPNAAEFRRLYQVFLPDSEAPPFDIKMSDTISQSRTDGDVVSVDDPSVADTVRLATAMGGCIIVRKGEIDIISDGRTAMFCKTRGSPRRCGGQGDVLAGSVATSLAWWKIAKNEAEKANKTDYGGGKKDDASRTMSDETGVMSAVWFSCHITRLCQRIAFDLHGRSMTAENVVAAMEIVIEKLFPVRGKL